MLDVQFKFTIETDTDVGWEEGSNIDNDNNSMEIPNVQIKLPPGGISISINMDESIQESVASDVQVISDN